MNWFGNLLGISSCRVFFISNLVIFQLLCVLFKIILFFPHNLRRYIFNSGKLGELEEFYNFQRTTTYNFDQNTNL